MEIKALSGERRRAPRVLLTADELHVVQERVPTLRLPARFLQQWTADLTADQRAGRTHAVITSLIGKYGVRADVPRR
ncbi:hypothetical protein [Cryobacterium sp. AP23]